MNDYANTVAQVIANLRNLFKGKDRLKGIDDWDNFLGCIIALEELKNDLQMVVNTASNEVPPESFVPPDPSKPFDPVDHSKENTAEGE